MIDWDDQRFFLAVVRTGSTIAASRVLGVNQTTVSRRIAQLEERVGAVLFDRQREGYRLKPAAEPLVALAEQAELTAQAFADLAASVARGLDHLRVTTNEPLANTVLAPAIAAFRAQRPEVRIDVVITPRQLDLMRGEADIALRAAPQPTEPDLIARRVGDAHWGVYCSRDYARFNGAPEGLADLERHTLLMIPDASGSRLGELVPAARREYREMVNDLCVSARAGLGVASLPCVLGDGMPDFVRCFVQPEPVTPVWLVYPERLRGAPEVRAFLDTVIQHTLDARDTLAGRITPA
ncbi:MAG: LysR family transcriptional regulator [Pseudomonadota bacterium]